MLLLPDTSCHVTAVDTTWRGNMGLMLTTVKLTKYCGLEDICIFLNILTAAVQSTKAVSMSILLMSVSWHLSSPVIGRTLHQYYTIWPSIVHMPRRVGHQIQIF